MMEKLLITIEKKNDSFFNLKLNKTGKNPSLRFQD